MLQGVVYEGETMVEIVHESVTEEVEEGEVCSSPEDLVSVLHHLDVQGGQLQLVGEVSVLLHGA